MADEVTELLTDIDISQEAAISPDSNFEQAILQSMKERGVKDLFDADGNGELSKVEFGNFVVWSILRASLTAEANKKR